MFEKKPKLTKEEQKAQESKQRFLETVKHFESEYSQLVEKYGVIHDIRFSFDQFRGTFPVIVVVDISKRLQDMKQKQVMSPESKLEVVKD